MPLITASKANSLLILVLFAEAVAPAISFGNAMPTDDDRTIATKPKARIRVFRERRLRKLSSYGEGRARLAAFRSYGRTARGLAGRDWIPSSFNLPRP